MTRKNDGATAAQIKGKAVRRIVAGVLIAAVLIAAALLLLGEKNDIKARIVKVKVLSASEDTDNYILTVDGSEFGYANNVYILVTKDTTVKKWDGKPFLAESLIAGDVIEVYYVKNTVDQNVITAKKVVFKAH